MFNKYFKSYQAQKSGAIRRGIEWKLTFREWRDWWGDDIDKRGRGANQLQMQRFNDTGPYALGNIVKGTPAQNAATANEQSKLRTEALIALGYVREPLNRQPSVLVAADVDVYGNPIVPEDEKDETWFGEQQYGRATPLGQWI